MHKNDHPRAKKSLGQHFLKHQNIAQNIVNLLDLSSNDNIIEIGPGPGILTNILTISPHNTLLLLEKDHNFAKQRHNKDIKNFHTLLIDALNFDWQRLNSIESWKIVGNLPYNVASPLIWDIVSKSKNITKAVFMVQKEVGQRIISKPGNKIYGALSIWVQSYAKAQLHYIIKPSSFIPPPKVDSCVISLDFLPIKQAPFIPKNLKYLLHLCFSQRRKQLKHIFHNANLDNLVDQCIHLKILPSKRPEELSIDEFKKLSIYLENINNI